MKLYIKEDNDTVNIEAKNVGVLEVPEGKDVRDLPIKHFKSLIDKKGRAKIIRALTNLEVWNKNDDKDLSNWAKAMKGKLKDYGIKTESLSMIEEEVKNISKDYLKVDLMQFVEDLQKIADDEFEVFFDNEYYMDSKEEFEARVDLFTKDDDKYTLHIKQTGKDEITMTCKENTSFKVVSDKPSVFADKIITLLI